MSTNALTAACGTSTGDWIPAYTAGDFTISPPNYYVNWWPSYAYYPTYDDTRVSALERENAALKAKVETLEKMVAALVGGRAPRRRAK